MVLEPILITARVTTFLEKFKVRYLIGGSLASTVHGMVRTTQDTDLVAELGPYHAHRDMSSPAAQVSSCLCFFRTVN